MTLGTIAIIADDFFGYVKAIKTALESRGFQVVLFNDRPAIDPMSKAMMRVAPLLMRRKATLHYAGIAETLKRANVSDVFVIKGEALTPRLARMLRRALPDARFTLYFWDNYRNMPKDSPEKATIFDTAFTFDRIDADKDPRLVYRPLFYHGGYERIDPDAPTDIDALFVGTAHTDRYPTLKRIAAQMPNIKFECIMYLPLSPMMFKARKIFDPRLRRAQRSEFIFTPLSADEVLTLVARTRVVIDIERSVQNGLTIRTIETLAAGKKLITSNRNILAADFYHPNNFYVVDRKKPSIDPGFFEAPYVPPSAAVLYRYSLQGWLDDVLPSTKHAADR